MSWDILPKGNLQYFLTKLKGKLDLKVDAVSGKGLSTNDYTTAEKNKLAGIEAGAQVNPTIDSALSDSSTNAVQNKIVKGALDGKADSGDILGSKSASGNPIVISDAANAYAEEVIANIEPIQDLHGYDFPWVGGAGKNLLPLTVDEIKSINKSGTWSGNAYTLNGVTFTIQTDSDGNVIGINANGTATELTVFYFPKPPFNNSYILNGCASGASGSTYKLQWYQYDGTHTVEDFGSGTSAFVPTGGSLRILMYSGATVNNAVFHPMARLSTETDSTFAPYSNISTITGITQLDIDGCGKNLFDLTQYTQYKNEKGITFTVNSDGSVSANGTATSQSQIYLSIPEEVAKSFSGMILNGAINRNCTVRFEKAENPWTKYAIDTGKGATIGEIPDGVGKCVLICRVEANTTINGTFYPMIRPTSITDPTFEPYTPNNYSLPLGQTVYGGTLNVQTGELVVDRASVDLGTLNWTLESTVFRLIQSIGAKLTTDTNAVANMICSVYKTVSQNDMGTANANQCIAGLNCGYGVRVKDTNYTDVTTFKQAMSGVQLVYELATPQTYHLTPSQVKLLLEHNNISTNADTLDIVYQVNNVLGEILSESEEYADRAIESLDDQYIKNDGVEGNSTNITSYNSTSNPFTTPTDGYIKFSVPLNYTDRYVTVYFLYPDLERIWLIKKIAGNNSYSFDDAIFVKKGTICMVYENSVDATVYFVS